MARDPQATRTAILDAAERLTFERGFAGAALDAILAASGSSKGAFFHHFANKQALGESLVARWAEGDAAQLEQKLTRAERLAQDPVQQVLIFLGLFIEEAEDAAAGGAGELPGCLFAAATYQAELFTAETRELVANSMLAWRTRLRAIFIRALAEHPRISADPDALADSLNVVFEGAFVVSRAVRDPGVVAAQLRLHRSLLAALFADPSTDAPGTAPGSSSVAHNGRVTSGDHED